MSEHKAKAIINTQLAVVRSNLQNTSSKIANSVIPSLHVVEMLEPSTTTGVPHLVFSAGLS